MAPIVTTLIVVMEMIGGPGLKISGVGITTSQHDYATEAQCKAAETAVRDMATRFTRKTEVTTACIYNGK